MLDCFEEALDEREKFVERHIDALGTNAVMDKTDAKVCARLLTEVDDVRSSVNDTLYTTDKRIMVVNAYNRGTFEHLFHFRKNGELYFPGHLVPTVFNLVRDMGITSLVAILAAFMHDDVEDLNILKEKLIVPGNDTKLLSPEFCKTEFIKIQNRVPLLVDGVTKVKRASREETKEATFKKLLEACCVMLLAGYIKLADRTNNMENIDGHGVNNIKRQKEIAQETEDLYIRLAHILELPEVEKKLIEYCFRTLNPEVYGQWKKWLLEKFREYVEPYKDKIKDQFTVAEAYIPGMISLEVVPTELQRQMYGNTKKVTHQRIAETEAEGIKLRDEDPGHTNVIIVRSENDIPAIMGRIMEKFGSGSNIQADIKPMNYRRGVFMKIYNKAFGGTVYFRINDIESEIRSKQGVLNSQRKNEWKRLQNEMKQVVEKPNGDKKSIFDLAENLLERNIIVYKEDGSALTLKKGSTGLDMAIAIHTDLLIGAQSGHSSDNRWGEKEEISLFAPLSAKSYIKLKSCLAKENPEPGKIKARASWKLHCGIEAQKAIQRYLNTLSQEQKKQSGKEDLMEFCETFGLEYYKCRDLLKKGLPKGKKNEETIHENIGGGNIDLLAKLEKEVPETNAWELWIELPDTPGQEARFRQSIFGKEINVDKNETTPIDEGKSRVNLTVSFSEKGDHPLSKKDFIKRMLRARLDGYHVVLKHLQQQKNQLSKHPNKTS